MGIIDKLLGRNKESEIDFDALTKHELERDPFRPQTDPLTQGGDPFDPAATGFSSPSAFSNPTRPSPYQESHFNSPEPPRFTAASQNPAPNYGRDKELELINSKLDTIKAMLTSMDQRISNLEQPQSPERRQRLW